MMTTQTTQGWLVEGARVSVRIDRFVRKSGIVTSVSPGAPTIVTVQLCGPSSPSDLACERATGGSVVAVAAHDVREEKRA